MFTLDHATAIYAHENFSVFDRKYISSVLSQKIATFAMFCFSCIAPCFGCRPKSTREQQMETESTREQQIKSEWEECFLEASKKEFVDGAFKKITGTWESQEKLLMQQLMRQLKCDLFRDGVFCNQIGMIPKTSEASQKDGLQHFVDNIKAHLPRLTSKQHFQILSLLQQGAWAPLVCSFAEKGWILVSNRAFSLTNTWSIFYDQDKEILNIYSNRTFLSEKEDQEKGSSALHVDIQQHFVVPANGEKMSCKLSYSNLVVPCLEKKLAQQPESLASTTVTRKQLDKLVCKAANKNETALNSLMSLALNAHAQPCIREYVMDKLIWLNAHVQPCLRAYIDKLVYEDADTDITAIDHLMFLLSNAHAQPCLREYIMNQLIWFIAWGKHPKIVIQKLMKLAASNDSIKEEEVMDRFKNLCIWGTPTAKKLVLPIILKKKSTILKGKNNQNKAISKKNRNHSRRKAPNMRFRKNGCRVR